MAEHAHREITQRELRNDSGTIMRGVERGESFTITRNTNIVIHLAALDPEQLPDEMVISAVTLAELSAGPHHADDPRERARRMSVLQHVEATFDPLPFDAEAARAFGLIAAAVLASGRGTRCSC